MNTFSEFLFDMMAASMRGIVAEHEITEQAKGEVKEGEKK